MAVSVRRRDRLAWALPLVTSALCTLFSGVALCQATTSSPGRLPLDAGAEPKPAPRDVPILIDKDRFAEQVPAGADAIRLRLSRIDLVGNQALPTSQFEPLWKGLVGRDIALSDIFAVAARISAAYRAAGYVLSQALVPQQSLSQTDGVVRIRIVEGYVSRVVVADDVAGRERIVTMLAPVQSERPLTLATLERSLLLLNDLPGTRAQALLRAAQEPNAAELELVVERDRQAYSASITNRTTDAVGPLRLELSGEWRGVVGNFDRHVVRWVGSGNERLNLIAYSGDAPIGSNGLFANWSASASRSKPKQGELFQFDTKSESLSFGLSYPVLRSRAINLNLRGALAAYDGSSDIVDGLTVSKEKIRTLRLGATFDATDSASGVNLLDIEWSKGLSGLGASRQGDPELARFGSNPQFSKLTLYAARLQSLGGEWSLLAAVTGQHTSDMLTSSEEFGLGGDTFLRAYDPSELLGDKGLAGKLELRYNLAFPALSTTLYAYYEGGSVRALQLDGSSSKQSAISTGLGVRASGPYGLKGYLEVAKPVNKPTAKNGNERARVFAGLAIDF